MTGKYKHSHPHLPVTHLPVTHLPRQAKCDGDRIPRVFTYPAVFASLDRRLIAITPSALKISWCDAQAILLNAVGVGDKSRARLNRVTPKYLAVQRQNGSPEKK